MHCSASWQGFPQKPQLFLSSMMLMQPSPWQFISPAGHWTHSPSSQYSCCPHGWLQPPQCSKDVFVSTQRPLQKYSGAHVHSPF
jgi:hypothetical protein